MKRSIIIVAIFLITFATTAYAQNNTFSVKAGTLGVGLEAERTFSDSIGSRVGVNYFTYSYSGTESDIEYDFDLNLMSVSALLDWHPLKGSFRISGGAIYNGNDIDGTGQLAATNNIIGDLPFTSDEVGTLKSEIDFNDIAPYLGLGWDTSFGKDNNFGFVLDIGAIYQGSPKVDLSADGTSASDPTFQSQLAIEEENLQDDLDEFKVYPVLSIGISYRF